MTELMRIFKRVLLIGAVSVAAAAMLQAQSSFNVASYNIRYDSSSDRTNGDGWEVRSKYLYDMINFEQWDIFGAQEVLHHQLHGLLSNLHGYDYVGVGRNDGATKGEYAPIFYRKDRMRCLEKGWFWISETPDVPGSKGWDADQCRICTWGRFEDNNTKWEFWFFNLHMDHIGVDARREGAKLVLAKIKELCNGEPYILTGDFNVDQNNEIFSILTGSGMLIDTYDSAKHRMAPAGTVNSFRSDYAPDTRIDHIFVSPSFCTHEYGIHTDNYWTSEENCLSGERADAVSYKARMISDHYPVAARVELPRLRAPEDWAQYGRYDQLNKEVTKRPKAVFIGDSITDNWYRNHPDFFAENNYLGRGIGGQVTAQMLARFRSDVLNHRPKYVVILAGTNDIAMNQGFVSLDHIFENIVSMAELAKANRIKVVLCSVLPAERYNWSWEISSERAISSIKELNERIEAYARANGHGYADYFSVMDDGKRGMIKEYQHDPVHPNEAGYCVMEEVIQKFLK